MGEACGEGEGEGEERKIGEARTECGRVKSAVKLERESKQLETD